MSTFFVNDTPIMLQMHYVPTQYDLNRLCSLILHQNDKLFHHAIAGNAELLRSAFVVYDT